MDKDIHEQLASHLSVMGMGLPHRDELVEILKENFTEQEAKIALMLPTTNTPLKPVTIEALAGSSTLDRKYLTAILEELAERKTDKEKNHLTAFDKPQGPDSSFRNSRRSGTSQPYFKPE